MQRSCRTRLLSLTFVILVACDAFGQKPDSPRSPDSMRHITISSVKPPNSDDAPNRSFVSRYGLLHRDFEAIVAYVDQVRAAVPVRRQNVEARNGRFTANIQLLGTTNAFAVVAGRRVVRGRFLTKRDAATRNNVAVLGSEAAEKLFLDREPIGQSIVIGGTTYLVVGRLAPVTVPKVTRAKATARRKKTRPRNVNFDVCIPLSTMKARHSHSGLAVIRNAGSFRAEQVELHEIHLAVNDPADVATTVDAIRRLLQRSHQAVDFHIRVVE